MKIAKPKGEVSALEREQARVYVESTLNVFLKPPKKLLLCLNQQYGVYDEEFKFVGDIMSRQTYFTKKELEQKVRELFEG